MVLDTRWKRFKYSYLNKLLCILLCFITALGASFIITAQAIAVSDEIEYGETAQNVFESENTYHRLNLGITTAVNRAVVDLSSYKKALKNCKKAACDNIYKKIADDNYGNSDDYYSKDYSYTPKLGEYSDGEYTFSYTYSYEYYTDEYGDAAEAVTEKLEGDALYSDIESKYDEYVSESASNYSVEVVNCDNGTYTSGFYYIVKNEKDETSSNTDLTVDEIKNEKYYFIIKNGKLEKCANDKLANAVEEIISGDGSASNRLNTGKYTLYGYIDLESGNPFHLEVEKLEIENALSNMGVLPYVVGFILAVISFAIGFYYFRLTGRKSDGEAAKLLFVDYVPLELQAGIIGGLGYVAAVLCFGLMDERLKLNIICEFFALFILISWGLLFAFCSSVSRYKNSGKKFYKHLIVYWICYILIAILRRALKGLRKLNGKIAESFKLFEYNPKTFVRNVILMAIGCFAFDIALIAATVIGFYGAPILAVISIIALLAFNGFVTASVCKYIKNLDELIYASSNHIDYAGELEKLPQSLKLLAESMKYTNTELQNAIAKAVKDERLRAELITNVSHDLKTPLTSIITYVDLLQKCDINDENAVKYIKILDEKGAKLKRLIDDLIEASKITSGSVTVNLLPLNLSELCLQSTVDVQRDFEKAGLELIVKQGERPVTVIADGAKTFRIIENLLSNAGKYSAGGTRVYVKVYENDGRGTFEIKNISAQPLDITPDELTERFVRGDEARSEGGNGLGLSIAKELCKAQGGTLELSIDGDLFKAKASFPCAQNRE